MYAWTGMASTDLSSVFTRPCHCALQHHHVLLCPSAVLLTKIETPANQGLVRVGQV